ncbi:MAG TPA: LLM class F420-dependent oxidoreductase [Kribbella sp.]
MRFGILAFADADGIAPQVLGRALEERGFDSLFVPEHSHIPVSRETPYNLGGELPDSYYRTVDQFVVLTAAAVTTTDLLLGTGITLLVQRDTIQTAKQVASLDALCGGRLIFGVGVGWNIEEMRNHGTDPRTRGKRLDEQLEALKLIWTQDKAEYHGQFVDFDPIFSWPKPARDPHPPIYIGGADSAATLRRVSRLGDGWMPVAVSDPKDIGPQLDRFRELAPDRALMINLLDWTDRKVLDGYAEGGAEHALLFVPWQKEDEMLHLLDSLVPMVEEYR